MRRDGTLGPAEPYGRAGRRTAAVSTRRGTSGSLHARSPLPVMPSRTNADGATQRSAALVRSGVERVAPTLERRLTLRRVPVHERPQEHRVRVAAHLVLDDEERLARRGVHDL